MTLLQLQDQIARLDILDMRVMEITGRYFAEELFIRLSYDPMKNFESLSFTGCTKINLQHGRGYQKLFSVKEYFLSKIPCHVRNIEVSNIEKDGVGRFQFILDLHPLEVLVVCRNLTVKNRNGDIVFAVIGDTSPKKQFGNAVRGFRSNAG